MLSDNQFPGEVILMLHVQDPTVRTTAVGWVSESVTPWPSSKCTKELCDPGTLANMKNHLFSHKVTDRKCAGLEESVSLSIFFLVSVSARPSSYPLYPRALPETIRNILLG